MTDLAPLVEELRRSTEWQRTPQAITLVEYQTMIINGLKYLFIITGRGSSYSDALVETDDSGGLTYSGTLDLTEQMIVLWAAQIEVFEKVRADKNAIVGYTTDALTVTNADKPFQYLSGTIDELRQKIRMAYYKLISYVGE